MNTQKETVKNFDIVTRLRLWHTAWDWYLPDQAADEIERLREQNEYLKANVEMLLAEAKAVRGDV